VFERGGRWDSRSKSTLPLLLLPQLEGKKFPPPILGRRVPVGELWIFSSCACG
jgi:hypothetical protein